MAGTAYRAGDSFLQILCKNTGLGIQKQCFQVSIPYAALITQGNRECLLFLHIFQFPVSRRKPLQVFFQFLFLSQKRFFRI